MKRPERLGIGIIGSGFNAQFHLRAFQQVRDCDIIGVWSPTARNAAATARMARELDVGPAEAYKSIRAMVEDPRIHAIWLSGPNQARIDNVEEITDTIERGRGELIGLACEKPLARNVAEAKQVVALARRARLKTGYLENQLFAPQVEIGRALLWARGAALTGRPYLARAAEEHSGPHKPWFWRGKLQGGGVLNDMMCHSALMVRHLLTRPGDPLSTVRPRRISAHIASLKWTRPEYARRLAREMPGVNYRRTPSEDFASVTIEFETADGHRVMGEATTSWSYVGAGLRLSAELLGPEYSMAWNTLDTGLKLFFSRQVRGRVGEDLVEKQNAEMGQMPVVAEEHAAYGYVNENRHFVRVFLGKEKPRLTFADGLETVRILMSSYKAAETGKTLRFPPAGIDRFVPKVAKGTWKP